MPNSRFYDNLAGFSDLKYEAGNLYGRLNGGSYVLIPTRGADGQDGADGADGTSAYVYHAFASDSSGTGFTLIDDGMLAWTSWITTNTPIANPSLADFTVWVRRKGIDGTNGANGTDGASAYVYVAWASDSSGTGFSLTPSASLPYRAELHTSTPIVSPTLADFSGVPFVNISGSSDIPIRQNSTRYTPGTRVLYPGKAGYVLVSTLGDSGSTLPAWPASVVSGETHIYGDGTVSWTIYDATAPEIATVNGLSAALAAKADASALNGKANTSLSNLTAHTAIDANCPVDYVIYRGTGTNTWYRIWKSGWVEQGGKATGVASSAGKPISFPVSFASTDYVFSLALKGGTSSAVGGIRASNSSVSKSGLTAITSYAGTGNPAYNAPDFVWYAAGQGDSTDIAALLE